MAKRVAIGIAVLFVLMFGGAAFVVGSAYLEHQRLVAEEIAAYPPPGMMVEAGEGRIHVHTLGAGEPTIVLMSGLGTAAPVLDFTPLTRHLADNFRVAAVERAGYGWSDITRAPRDLATVLEETRTALRLAGETPPYVLMPHSLAGLEALHWAREHPNEVAAIVGLDPLVPGYLERGGEHAWLSPMVTLLARTGLMRQGEDVFERHFPAMVRGVLSEQQAVVARALFMRRTNTANMREEVRALEANARLLHEAGPPDVPLLLFVSGEGAPIRKDSLTDYAQLAGGTAQIVEASHYPHLDIPGRIARTTKGFIEAR